MPRLRGAAFEARAPEVETNSQGLPNKTSGAMSLRRSEYGATREVQQEQVGAEH